MQVDYPDNSKDSFRIYFDEEFFKIEGISEMDTTALMSYLSPFEHFETNEFISKGFSAPYDSLVQTKALAVISVDDINQDRSQQLTLFPKLENDNYILGVNRDGEISLFDFRRIRQLLAKKEDFGRN